MWSRKDHAIEQCKEAVEACQDLLKSLRSRIRAQQSRISLLEHQMRQVRVHLSKYELAVVEGNQEFDEELVEPEAKEQKRRGSHGVNGSALAALPFPERL